MSNSPEHANREARLANLWKECITLWRNLVLGFGDSVLLMRWGRMRALEHRAFGHWLRDLEALVRRAVASDALSREVPASGLHRPRHVDKRSKRPASPEDMPRFRATDRTDPTTWKVSFRMSEREYDPARRRKRSRTCRRNTDPEARRPCRGYAFRIEALRRVIQYREAVVMRYARRLARLAEAEAGRTYYPIQLPAAPVEDAPSHDPPGRAADRQPILLSAGIAEAPRAGTVTSLEAPPRNAKYAEPG
jgi:hypothetical protein